MEPSPGSGGADLVAPRPSRQPSTGSPMDIDIPRVQPHGIDTPPVDLYDKEKSRKRKRKGKKTVNSDPDWVPDARLAKEIEKMQSDAQEPKITMESLALKKKDGHDLFGYPYCETCGKNTLFTSEEERGYCEVCAEEMATEEEATKEEAAQEETL
ncbi:hypothetical protein KC349_g2995 [Hortaea werneckii]|nr:hypothetical protein KC349_g2995 [Hortaea werneckii]